MNRDRGRFIDDCRINIALPGNIYAGAHEDDCADMNLPGVEVLREIGHTAIRSLKALYGAGYVWDREGCELFFDDERNFVRV